MGTDCNSDARDGKKDSNPSKRVCGDFTNGIERLECEGNNQKVSDGENVGFQERGLGTSKAGEIRVGQPGVRPAQEGTRIKSHALFLKGVKKIPSSGPSKHLHFTIKQVRFSLVLYKSSSHFNDFCLNKKAKFLMKKQYYQQPILSNFYH